ncbi:DUF2167 domain-containing protein [Viridibacterium curvum]|uniref:DUF2167 domain-containing protein n=1 Tax=Viridibacterium curvum TaxID=1101404 RepID=A0ABP9QTN4_9RHOO
MKTARKSVIGAAFATLLAFTGPAFAQDGAGQDKQQQEMESAVAAVRTALQPGPVEIPLTDQAKLKLPAGYAFVPKAEAARWMSAMGNHTDARFIGVIVGDKIEGFVTVDFEKSGYIKDEDAKTWNADELLSNIREGTAEGNKDRAARGLPEMDIIGWVEKPGYDAGTHRLIWSISSRNKGAPADSEQGINYNTYVLGREGYLTLNLVTGLKEIEAQKPLARELLAAVNFNEGKRYEDFNADTDKVAEYGLAALVGGIAAKKLGLLAVIGAFMLKAWKLVLIGVVALGAGAKKLFGRNDEA